MTTGERIYAARKRAGMTQEDLADRLNVTRQAVSRWESDAAFPETEKLIELCKLFSLSADELLLGVNPREDTRREQPQEPKQESGFGKIIHRGEFRFEYVSKMHWGKLPLVHINIGLGVCRAKGIIAVGNIATGVVSLGFLSVGVLAIGLLSLGLLAFGSCALALLLGAGGVATGLLAFGGLAVGIMTFGGVSVEYIAVGGAAFGQYAVGGSAYAWLAAGNVNASGAHAFIMPNDYERLCEFLAENVHGWLGSFLRNVALSVSHG